MKKLIAIPTLMVLATALSGCYTVMKWYKKATSVVSKNGLYAEIATNGDGTITTELTADFGTEIDKNDKVVPSMATEFLPTSFNHNDLSFVYQTNDGSGYESADYQFINSHREKGTQAYYVGFGMRVNTTLTDKIVQLDVDASDIQVDASKNVSSGVRMAFLNHSQPDVKPLVWAPNQIRENACYHDGHSEVHYGDEDKFIASDDIISEGAGYVWDSDFENKKNYRTCLGYNDGNLSTFGMTILVWFEGTDSSITNSVFDGECQVHARITLRLV